MFWPIVILSSPKIWDNVYKKKAFDDEAGIIKNELFLWLTSANH